MKCPHGGGKVWYHSTSVASAAYWAYQKQGDFTLFAALEHSEGAVSGHCQQVLAAAREGHLRDCQRVCLQRLPCRRPHSHIPQPHRSKLCCLRLHQQQAHCSHSRHCANLRAAFQLLSHCTFYIFCMSGIVTCVAKNRLHASVCGQSGSEVGHFSQVDRQF